MSSTKQRLLSRLDEVCAGLGGAKCSPGAKLLRSGVAQHENARAGWNTCADATRVFHGACGYADSGALGQANAHVAARGGGAAAEYFASVFYATLVIMLHCIEAFNAFRVEFFL